MSRSHIGINSWDSQSWLSVQWGIEWPWKSIYGHNSVGLSRSGLLQQEGLSLNVGANTLGPGVQGWIRRERWAPASISLRLWSQCDQLCQDVAVFPGNMWADTDPLPLSYCCQILVSVRTQNNQDRVIKENTRYRLKRPNGNMDQKQWIKSFGCCFVFINYKRIKLEKFW